MSVLTERTVREIALELPGATRVFEKLGIDYCCGGNQPLDQACQRANVPLKQVIDSLETMDLASGAATKDRDWQSEPLADLVAHIQNTHHKFTRGEIARLDPLAAKVCAAHGKNHSELEGIRATFGALAQELTTHMLKEETVLFPYILRLEESAIQKERVLPPPFGTVNNPISMMKHEHDVAGQALLDLRWASNGYTTPADGCVSYQTLYRALADFETDLHQHIHLENNILFPRAIEMERQCR